MSWLCHLEVERIVVWHQNLHLFINFKQVITISAGSFLATKCGSFLVTLGCVSCRDNATKGVGLLSGEETGEFNHITSPSSVGGTGSVVIMWICSIQTYNLWKKPHVYGWTAEKWTIVWEVCLVTWTFSLLVKVGVQLFFNLSSWAAWVLSLKIKIKLLRVTMWV